MISDGLLISLMISGIFSGIAIELGACGLIVGILMESFIRLEIDRVHNRKTAWKLIVGGGVLLFAGLFGFLTIGVITS